MLMNVLLEERFVLDLGSVLIFLGVTFVSVIKVSILCILEVNINVTVTNFNYCYVFFFLWRRKVF